jgi:hypothetical protein
MTFKKIKNKNNEVVQLASGSALRSELYNIASTSENEALNQQASELSRKDSSLLFRKYLDQNGVTATDALRAMGINDIGSTKVRALYDNTGVKPLFNTVIEDGIRRGFEKTGRASELLAKTVPINELTYGWYTMEDPEGKAKDLDMKLVGQGGPIPTQVITIDDKRSVRVYKRGAGIEITDEAKSMSFDLLALNLELRGKQMGRTDEKILIQRMLNGYFADGHDTPEKIGVKNAGTFALSDAWYTAQWMGMERGFTPNRAIMNLNMAEEWATQKLDSSGALLFGQELRNGQMPDVMNTKPFISDQMPDGQILFVDTNYAMVEYEYKGFSVENDRNVQTQVDGSYATKTSDFVTFQQDARILLDVSMARS